MPNRRVADRRPLPLGLLALVVLLVSAACSGSAPDNNANYAQIDDLPATDGLALTSSAQQNSGEDVGPTPDFLEIESLIGDYLSLRADVVTNRAELSELDGLATGQALDAVTAERETNEAARTNEYYSTVEVLWLWPNIVDIEWAGQDLIVTGCDERQEINAIEQRNLWFLTNEYRLAPAGDGWMITGAEELHNGFLESGERFGCAPQSFQERAEAASAQMWTELIDIARTPESVTASDLSDVFGKDLREVIEQAAAEANGATPALTSREDIFFTTVGIDTQADLLPFGRKEPGTTVVVESCRRFVEGMWFDDPATGDRLNSMPPGSELVQHLYVRLDTRSNEAGPDKVVLIETLPDATCTKAAS